MAEIVQVLFILLVPLVVVGGAVATLFGIGALFNALEHPELLRERVERAFRRPPKPAKKPDRDHYYSAPWAGGEKPREER
jgi:hypothetical protein